jgi:hypothetical protein
VYDHPVEDGSTVRGAWSLRMIVLSREPESAHARWKDASKAQLVAQCNTYADFKFEKTMLQWIAFSKGHSVVYGVRFHCECAPVEALWAYIVHLLRQKLDGTPATLLALLAEFLAWAVKPDVSARLFNRPGSMLWRMADVLFRATETALRDRVRLTAEEAARLQALTGEEMPEAALLPWQPAAEQ